jgi:anthranilate synthase
MQFIEDNEDTPRRWYGGAVGKIGFDGSMNTGLTLRTAHISGGIAAVRAGATLLFDSDPAAEERETHIKARALMETLAESEPSAEAPAPGGNRGVRGRVVPPGQALHVLLVDHQDSFVHTLGDYLRQHEAEVTTLRAGFPHAMLDELAPDLVVLSPGPGKPSDFGCDELLTQLDQRGLPAFGVCLGLQAMVEHCGGELSLLPLPQHGKPGQVTVRPGSALLAGLPEVFTAARYHSLYATEDHVKGGFTVSATTQDRCVMAIEDEAAGRWAVQFHPESILTAAGRCGHQVIANVLGLARARITAPGRPSR